MAKLENVKILDMVNGEPTRVEYNGAVYEKADDEAKAGDLVRVIDALYITCVEDGGFYDVFDRHDRLMFLDDYGDFRPYKLNRRGFETFRKVSETKASADLAERLAELERRLEALEERAGVKEESEAESAPKFKVGDYAKVIAEGMWSDIGVGNIVKIVGPKDEDGDYKAELLDGSDYDYFRDEHLEKVTEEEARWAKIGRKPGEFKKGDIVRVIDSASHKICSGEIGILGEKDFAGLFRVLVRDVTTCNWHSPQRLELIAPVEQRFDFAGAQSVAAEGACQ
jgi:hypothetical protein